MEYIILFLEGIVTFISPCLLPMLPVYISYFAGQSSDGNKKSTLIRAVGFVIGFTIIFVMLGAFAGTVGRFLWEYNRAVNIVTGIIVILFGLNFMEVIQIPFLQMSRHVEMKKSVSGFASSVLFGMVFSIGWTPCVSAFLGSALMLAASSGDSVKGIMMLLVFSLGLGIPFVVSALLIDRLKSAFDFIKKHYRIITRVSGALLVLVGILMASGYMGYFLTLLTF